MILPYKNRGGEPLKENNPLGSSGLQTTARFAAWSVEPLSLDGGGRNPVPGFAGAEIARHFDLHPRSFFLRGYIT